MTWIASGIYLWDTERMSELFSAIPRMFAFRARNDYAECVSRARADAVLHRSMSKTHRQLVSAYETVVGDAAKKDNSRNKRS